MLFYLKEYRQHGRVKFELHGDSILAGDKGA